MKVAICSYGEFSFDCPKYEDYVQFTNQLKREYCNYHQGVDYIWGDDGIDRTRDLHFARFKMMVHILQKGYDWVLYMDCDAAPVNFSKDLRLWLSTKPNDKVILQNDVLGINSGVMAVPNSPRCIEWLEYLDSREIYDEYINRRFLDQDAISDSLKEERWKDLRIEPEPSFGFNHFENLYQWYMRDNVSCPNQYRRGDFCLHLAGYANAYRTRRFRQELEDFKGIHCPICNCNARPYFSVPFDKTPEGVVSDERLKLRIAEKDCMYFKCPDCGYIFSPLFEVYWKELKSQIYSEDYGAIDDTRTNDAKALKLYKSLERTLQTGGDRVLDFGGWYSSFCDYVNAESGLWADRMDLFFTEKPELPPRNTKYTAVLCLNSLERLVQPAEPFAFASMALASHGRLMVRTPIYDQDEESSLALPMDWPCVAPRLGIVGVHSTGSLRILAARYGFNYKRGQSDGNLAVFEKMHDVGF